MIRRQFGELTEDYFEEKPRRREELVLLQQEVSQKSLLKKVKAVLTFFNLFPAEQPHDKVR